MTSFTYNLLPTYQEPQKPVKSPRFNKLVIVCGVSLLLTGLYISRTWITSDKPNTNCPILHNGNSCVHRSANLAGLTDRCPNFKSVADCRSQQYDVIITGKDFIEVFGDFTNMMVVPESDIGEYLDRFVQKNSRWTIDLMGGDGYEILTSVVEPDRLALQKDLDRLQNKCTNFFYGALGNAGFGSNWHAMGLALARTVFFDMTFFPGLKFEYLIPATTCTEEQMEASFSKNIPESNIYHWNESTINYKSLSWDVLEMMLSIDIIKPQYRSKGLFWWRSMLTNYVTRPNYKMREAMRQLSTFKTPCISIHVRHSDKWSEASLRGFDEYAVHAEAYRNATGVSNVYLMTDDQAVIDATRNYTNFQFQYLNLTRTNQGWAEDANHGLAIDVQEKNFLLDVLSAAQCQHKIVTYSSNVGRLIGELSYAAHDVEPDVVSLDVPWGMNP